MRSKPSGPPSASARPSSGGVGRSGSAAAEAVSDDLRRGTGDWLEERRRMAALGLGAMASMGVVAAYQYGITRRPPEPALPALDAEAVDASGEAYQLLRTPDAALGLVNYAVTLVLVGMGDRRRSTARPHGPNVHAPQGVHDPAAAPVLNPPPGTKHRKLCSWCLAAAAASVAMVPTALPEARAALRTLRGRVA
ncbi:MAG: hypothetical protein WKF93_02030 [Acidimicrobiales bacterium]